MADRDMIALIADLDRALKPVWKQADPAVKYASICAMERLQAAAAQLKADECGGAEPVARVVRRWPHYNLGVELISERPVKEGDQLYLRSDSAQARDAAQAVELTDADIIAAMEEVDYAHELSTIARAIERAVLAKNGLGGKQ
jgi:hypothetical protein